MKKLSIFLIFCLLGCSSLKKNEKNNYIKNLNSVIKFNNNGNVGKVPNVEIEYLQGITGIKCNYFASIEQIYEPDKAVIESWKNWYISNKIEQTNFQLEKHLKNIKNSLNEKKAYNLEESVLIFERLSLIKSFDIQQFEHIYCPVKYNFNDWLEFYNLNKNSFTINNENIIVLINEPKYLEKNSNELINFYLDELEKVYKNKELSGPEFEYILDQLSNISNIHFEISYKGDYPTKLEINNWRTMFNENATRIHWEKSSQQLKLKQ